MTTIRLKYLHRYTDRHDKQHIYFRRPGINVPLPGLPGSAEFMDAYQAALAGTRPQEIGAARTKPGTINALVVRYYASVEFTNNLAPITKVTYRNVIERFRAEHGDKLVAALEQKHVKGIIHALATTPGAANKMLRTIKTLMRFAVAEGWRTDDPTFTVKKVRLRSDEGFHPWSEAEVATYEARHPVGTKARLALDLLLWTDQRRGDVVRMGPQHVERIDGDDWITFRQQKTGTLLSIPIHPKLAASLAAMATVGLRTFLVTEYGKPFTAAGFGNWFRDRCNEAGLPQCSAHGLRKTLLTRGADAGGTGHELMGMSGHRHSAQVDTYTRSANQRTQARALMDKLIKAGR